MVLGFNVPYSGRFWDTLLPPIFATEEEGCRFLKIISNRLNSTTGKGKGKVVHVLN
jgi:hypothetical protein